MTPRRRIRLAVHFPGVNNTSVWTDHRAGSQIEFGSFATLARTAERAKFDFFFLAEGLRMREHAGHLQELDVAGRPDGFAILAALAAVTERLGLVTTVTTTYHEPHEVARQLGSIDHLSAGRAGWNLVTSADAFTGANFRRGPYLDYAERYLRGGQFIEASAALWDSWRTGAGSFAFHGSHVDIAGQFTVPPLPQGRPVLLQAGDSDAGREFAARHADGIFSRHGRLEDGQSFYRDVKGRLARHGRCPDELLVLPGATFVLGDSDAEANELAREVRRAQVSGPHAIMFLEQLWNRDLSAYDPDGPLPEVEPDVDAEARAQGSAQARTLHREAIATAQAWRERARAGGLSVRDLVIEMTARQAFVGSPETVAREIDAHVQAQACDGFILIPHLTPGGLDRFADEVVPRLQERGSFRSDYEGSTLREHLGLHHVPTEPRRARRATAGTNPDHHTSPLAEVRR